MFSLGGTELLLIAVVALMLFGPDKIPQMARTVGRFMREFNKYKDIMESTVRAEFLSEQWSSGTAEADTKSASERIEQAAKASQDLLESREAATASAADAPAGAAPEATTDASPAPAPGPATATDEDEEDEA